MLISFDASRRSDSPLVERVWRSHSEQGGPFLSIAEARWELVVARTEGKTSLVVRGPETRATEVVCPAEGEWIALRFRLGTFLPAFPPGRLRDHRSVTLPAASSRRFWLEGSAWDYPDFDDAEVFVERLRRRGLIAVDPVVAGALEGGGADVAPVVARTVERHFLRATGVTRGEALRIERARFATRRLREGATPADAAVEAGYFDQAHLTRSLGRYVGQTPGAVRRSERQLSFLYKTGADAAG